MRGSLRCLQETEVKCDPKGMTAVITAMALQLINQGCCGVTQPGNSKPRKHRRKALKGGAEAPLLGSDLFLLPTRPPSATAPQFRRYRLTHCNPSIPRSPEQNKVGGLVRPMNGW